MSNFLVQSDRPAVPWSATNGMYLAGRAHIDEVDALAAELEAKWGVGRLRLLVSPELREKFDRQRYLFDQALWHGQLEDVRQQSRRMLNAWRAVDAAATTAGAVRLDPDRVWEIGLADGSVAAIVPDSSHVSAAIAEGRLVRVYTLDEIARLLVAFPGLAAAKEVFPGATVVAARRPEGDPLNAVHDTKEPLDLDGEIPFGMEAA